jgi:hypothetical protein
MGTLTPIGSVTERLQKLIQSGLSGGEKVASLAALPIPWLWRPFVVTGTIVLVGGSPWGGKTTLLFLLATLRAGEEEVDFLGHPLTPAPEGQYVVFIEAEQSEKAAARKWVRCAKALKTPIPDRMILLARDQVRVGSSRWGQIISLAREGLISDIFLDTLASTTDAEAKDEQAQAALFQQFVTVIRSSPADFPVTIWIAAHTRKDNSDGLQGISGSNQRTAQSDTVMTVEVARHPKTQKITNAKLSFKKLKEDPPDEDDISDIKYFVHPEKGVVVLAKPSQGALGRPVNLDAASLLTYLRGLPPETRMSAKKLEASLQGGREELKRLLLEGVGAGDIQTAKEVRYGNEVDVFWAVTKK